MFFRRSKPTPVPPLEPVWEGKTFDQIMALWRAVANNGLTNRSSLFLLKRLDEIALLDRDTSPQDRIDAGKLADAVERDLVAGSPEIAEKLAEARLVTRAAAARNDYVDKLSVEIDKIAEVIGSPNLNTILTRLDSEQNRQGLATTIDHCIANRHPPDKAGGVILLQFLDLMGEHAARQRLEKYLQLTFNYKP